MHCKVIAFASSADDVENNLSPYSCENIDVFCEFEDCSSDFDYEYRQSKYPYVIAPDGRKVSRLEYSDYNKYKNQGAVEQEDYLCNIYDEDTAASRLGYTVQDGQYGHLFNPEGIFDYFTVESQHSLANILPDVDWKAQSREDLIASEKLKQRFRDAFDTYSCMFRYCRVYLALSRAIVDYNIPSFEKAAHMGMWRMLQAFCDWSVETLFYGEDICSLDYRDANSLFDILWPFIVDANQDGLDMFIVDYHI